MKKRLFTFLFLFAAITVSAQTPISIKNTAKSGAFPLVANGQAAQIVVDAQDIEVVTVAAAAFKGDIQL
ncbi:MAG: hypothetical protein LBN23_05865, partial [Paludibacter sp.]|nr:hypothetical protein [Paludibacter sp.]